MRLSLAGFKETNGHVGEAHRTMNSELPSDPQLARNKTICPTAHKELDAVINHVNLEVASSPIDPHLRPQPQPTKTLTADL